MEVNKDGEFVKPSRIMAIERNLEFIYKMNNYLMESKDIKEVFDKLLDGIFNLFKRVDRCVIIIVDNQTGEFTNILYRSRKPVDDPKKIYNKELVEKALLMNKPVMVKDSSKSEDEDDRLTESLQLMNIKSAMCVPITSIYSIRGIIYVDSLSRPKGFRKNDLALLKDVSGRAALALDHVSLQMGYDLGDYKKLLEYLNSTITQQ